jgi:hypothetical protein
MNNELFLFHQGCDNNGFRIGFQGDRHFRASPNLKSASEFPEIVEEKLAKDLVDLSCYFPNVYLRGT